MPMTTETVDRASTRTTDLHEVGRDGGARAGQRQPKSTLWYRILAKFRGLLGPEHVHHEDADAHSWKLRVVVEKDDLDGGYIARCLELPGCLSQGETEKEALENLNDAIGGVISARLHTHVEAQDYKTVKGADGDKICFEIAV
jgi:predicted RNase H-like HicB family nuclease